MCDGDGNTQVHHKQCLFIFVDLFVWRLTAIIVPLTHINRKRRVQWEANQFNRNYLLVFVFRWVFLVFLRTHKY